MTPGPITVLASIGPGGTDGCARRQAAISSAPYYRSATWPETGGRRSGRSGDDTLELGQGVVEPLTHLTGCAAVTARLRLVAEE